MPRILVSGGNFSEEAHTRVAGIAKSKADVREVRELFGNLRHALQVLEELMLRSSEPATVFVTSDGEQPCDQGATLRSPKIAYTIKEVTGVLGVVGLTCTRRSRMES